MFSEVVSLYLTRSSKGAEWQSINWNFAFWSRESWISFSAVKSILPPVNEVNAKE